MNIFKNVPSKDITIAILWFLTCFSVAKIKDISFPKI